jgi:hypothetical protein
MSHKPCQGGKWIRQLLPGQAGPCVLSPGNPMTSYEFLRTARGLVLAT